MEHNIGGLAKKPTKFVSYKLALLSTTISLLFSCIIVIVYAKFISTRNMIVV